MVNRVRRLGSWLWPGTCLLCRAPTGAHHGLCDPCHAGLPWLTYACPRCAAPLSTDPAGRVCGKCQQQTPLFARTYAALRYQAPVDRLVVQLKYRRRLDLTRLLGELLATRLEGTVQAPDVLVPVPLHASRLRERGYNQSLEIARVLARRLCLPLEAYASRRRRATLAQTALPLKLRARNVRNAFAVNDKLAGKRVAIVDDVMTSGHTVGALAKALRRAGAEDISVWVVARA